MNGLWRLYLTQYGYDELKLYHEGDDGGDDGRGGIHDSGDVHSICALCRNNWAVATISRKHDTAMTKSTSHHDGDDGDDGNGAAELKIAAICSICALCRRTLGFGGIE